MTIKKIAIIGGGAAGTAALWALSQTQHQVMLFEAEPCLGGHAYTYQLEIDGKQVYVDMGVEYFHEKLSPNLSAILKEFNIATYIAPLSFRAFNKNDPEKIYWSNNQVSGDLKQRFHDEMNRFHLDMLMIQKEENLHYKGLSIGEFLLQKNYTREFQQQVLLPLMTTFSGCKAPSLDYSLMYVALSFNMNLLSFFSPSHWRKTSNGINQYFKKINQLLSEKIYLNCPVESVEKSKSTIEVVLKNKKAIIVDEVIFACQAEIANRLLKNSSPLQRSLLGSFEYINIQSILHSDTRAISKKPLSHEYCQFELAEETLCNDFAGFLTRVNHHLYPYQSLSEPVYVSFDSLERIDPAKIFAIKNWKLPKLRPKDLLRKSKIHRIQGQNNYWFCGTDYSLTGHEGALVSGLVIAHHLGADYRFVDNWLAKIQFDTIKNFMGVYSKQEKILKKLDTLLFILAKKFNLHKRLANRYRYDLLF